MKRTDYIEYKMAKEMAKTLLKSRKGKEKNIDNNKYLCDLVNREFGLRGTCVKVIIF